MIDEPTNHEPTNHEPLWRLLNRAMWDAKAPLHVKSRLYDVPGFKAGGIALKPHEVADLGDLTGKDVIHPQCHFGLDTLSLARLGANVTGVDFSAPAIEAAKGIARDIGVDATFVTADVHDAPAAVGRRVFDIVYTGVGALCWLPDMDRWARVVCDLLRPGGQLYLFEFHPVKWMIEGSAPGGIEIRDSYFTPPDGFHEAGGVAYADESIPSAATPTIQWSHPLGEVVTALARTGMRIDELRELDRDVLSLWNGMERTSDGMWRMPPDWPALPMMYVLRAHREG